MAPPAGVLGAARYATPSAATYPDKLGSPYGGASPPDRNGMHAVVFGIVSLVTSVLCIGLLFSFLGVAKARAGLRFARHSPTSQGYGASVSGMTLSIIGLLMSGLWLAAVVAALIDQS